MVTVEKTASVVYKITDLELLKLVTSEIKLQLGDNVVVKGISKQVNDPSYWIIEV